MKENIFNLLNYNERFIKFIYTLIILNVVLVILASYKEIGLKYEYYLDIFEVISVIIFSIEFLLRLWVADNETQDKNSPILSRIKFIFSFQGLVDLLAIIPFYLPMFFPFDQRSIRILRLFRLLRILKLGRFSKSIKTINNVLMETRIELGMTIFIAFILLVFSSTLMYYVEGDVQPEKFASIGHTFWWSIATLTTVGYGDVFPITALGKLLSAFIALIGIGFIALPTGIISSAFIKKIQFSNEAQECTCPNCNYNFTPEQ
ncbi:MAG: voltage-gated potassium channel [Saprospiraceae bacterium]|jgi:voltage-gated potassium channel